MPSLYDSSDLPGTLSVIRPVWVKKEQPSQVSTPPSSPGSTMVVIGITQMAPHICSGGGVGMCDKNKHCKKNLLFHMLMQNLDLHISQMSECMPSVPELKKRDWQLHLDNYLWILSISIIHYYSLWMFSHPAFPNDSWMLFCTNCDAQHY